MTEHSRTQTLVERAAAGNRDAFDDLVRSHESRLRSSLEAQLGAGARADEADEVVQETLVLAFQAIGRFQWRGEASFFSWLLRIARNVAIDHVSDARRSRYLEVPDQVPASDSPPSRILRRDERFERLENAVGQLPPDYREAIRLAQLERLKVREIAARMGRSEYAVKHLLARALRRLRETIGDTESLGLPDRPLQVEGDRRDDE